MKNEKLKTTTKNLKLDLKKRSYIYALMILKFVGSLPKDEVVKIIINQLVRSSTSIGANVIEAQASSSRRDFINFFHHALKSANECKFWIGLLRDSHKADQMEANKLLKETNELANILGSSLLTLKGKK